MYEDDQADAQNQLTGQRNRIPDDVRSNPGQVSLFLKKYATASPPIVLDALDSINRLLDTEAAQEEMLQYGIIHGLTRVLREYLEKDERIVISTLRIIAQYMNNDSAAKTFLSLNGAELLILTITVFMNSNSTILILVFSAIDNICHTKELAATAVKQELINAVMIPFDFFFGKDEDLIRRMMLALASLASSDEGKEIAHLNGCTHVVLTVLSLYSGNNSRVCVAACKLLREMVESPHVCEFVVGSGVVPTLIETFAKTLNEPLDERLTQAILSVLVLVSSHQPQSLLENETITQLTEGLCILQNNSTIIHSIFVIFTQLVSQGPENTVDQFLSLSILPPVVAAFRLHCANNQSITRIGTGLLALLAQNDHGSLECVEEGVVELLVSIVRNNSDQPEILINSTCVLSFMIRPTDPQHRSLFLQKAESSDLIPVLLKLCCQLSSEQIESFYWFLRHTITVISHILANPTPTLLAQCLSTPLTDPLENTTQTTSPDTQVASPSSQKSKQDQYEEDSTDATQNQEKVDENEASQSDTQSPSQSSQRDEQNQLETTGTSEEHVSSESIQTRKPTPPSTPPSTLPPDPPHTQPQPASTESSPTTKAPDAVESETPNPLLLAMLTLHEISCESDDQGLMSDCLTMLSNLFIQLQKREKTEGEGKDDVEVISDRVVDIASQCLQWMRVQLSKAQQQTNSLQEERSVDEESERSLPHAITTTHLINSFAPFFGNAALCLDNLNKLRASPSPSLLAIAVFCGGLTVLFDCIHLLSEGDEDESSSEGHRERQVLMRVWLAVVNVFHLSLHSGSEGRHAAAAEIDAGVLEMLQTSFSKESMRNVQHDAVLDETDRQRGSEEQIAVRKDRKMAQVLIRVTELLQLIVSTSDAAGEADTSLATTPEPKSNRVRSEDVCQLGASVCLLMQSVWGSLDLSVPNEWRVLGESIKTLRMLVELARDSEWIILVPNDTPDEESDDEQREEKDEEEKEEDKKEGEEEETAEGAPTEDTTRTENNSHVVDHVSPIRHADTLHARPRRLPNINNAGLALVEIVSAAVRLNNWAVAQDAGSVIVTLLNSAVMANTIELGQALESDEEQMVSHISQSLKLTEKRCRELRFTEPGVEKETDEDSTAELAECLQVELTLHALLAELNTIDLTTVLSKTQVLSALLSSVTQYPPVSLLSSALSLLYLAASSPVGAAKLRQLNGVVILASVLQTLLTHTAQSSSALSTSPQKEQEPESLRDEVEMCCGVLALLSVNEKTRKVFAVEGVIDVALRLIKLEAKQLTSAVNTKKGKTPQDDPSNVLFFVLSLLCNISTVPEIVPMILRNRSRTTLLLSELVQQTTQAVLQIKLCRVLINCLDPQVDEEEGEEKADTPQKKSECLDDYTLFVLVPALLEIVRGITAAKKGKGEKEGEADAEENELLQMLLHLLSVSVVLSPLTTPSDKKNKKKSKAAETNEQKVRLAVSLLDERDGWDVLNAAIQLGVERGDATVVGYGLAITTAMASLKSLSKSSCLTTLVASFKSASAHAQLSASPGIILAFLDTLTLLSLHVSLLPHLARSGAVEEAAAALKRALKTISRKKLVLRPASPRSPRSPRGRNGQGDDNTTKQDAFADAPSPLTSPSTDPSLAQPTSDTASDNALLVILHASMLLVSASFACVPFRQRVSQAGLETTVRDGQKWLRDDTNTLEVQALAMLKRLQRVVELDNKADTLKTQMKDAQKATPATKQRPSTAVHKTAAKKPIGQRA
ncbi:hypothetical protein BLNAU_10636 [Blattamonas nauphoetae]|uniref:Uncharacterized protein n=1 Tax=Blattamonas nauphoetae TaxID=2049346 RepID=A0ABQ9XS54_9EUKA|nr:hypothetical protein BLNAU_10636 [Blattamonas nauphoetae]